MYLTYSTHVALSTAQTIQSPNGEAISDTMTANTFYGYQAQEDFGGGCWYVTKDNQWQDPEYSEEMGIYAMDMREYSNYDNWGSSFSPQPSVFTLTPVVDLEHHYCEEGWSENCANPQRTPLSSTDRCFPLASCAGEHREPPRLSKTGNRFASTRPRSRQTAGIDEAAEKSMKRRRPHAHITQALTPATVPRYVDDSFAPQKYRAKSQTPQQYVHHGGNASPRAGAASAHSPTASLRPIKEEPSPDATSPSAPPQDESQISQMEESISSLPNPHPFQCTDPGCGKKFKRSWEWKRHESAIHWRLKMWICMPDNSPVIDRKCAFCGSDDTTAAHFVGHNISKCSNQEKKHEYMRKVRPQSESISPLYT